MGSNNSDDSCRQLDLFADYMVLSNVPCLQCVLDFHWDKKEDVRDGSGESVSGGSLNFRDNKLVKGLTE